MPDNNTSMDAFNLLSRGCQQWVSKQGWNSLRDIQSAAISSILGDNAPAMVVSAGTAMGKTESAFLPALTMAQTFMDENRDDDFVFLLYVAPLKALINDQYRRMLDMAGYCNIPVYLWHGDAPQGQKKELLRNHCGILMTTPESLESFLMNRDQWCSDHLTPLAVIIDEFHAFLGNGRGKQLLSLLSRIDMISITNNRSVAKRIALSATLSKLATVGKILSPKTTCAIIDGTALGSSETEIEVQTFRQPEAAEGRRREKNDINAMAEVIVNDSKKQKTLTFAKSRMEVEQVAATINEYCQNHNINQQAFPHHGSLSKETREELEKRLVNTNKPTIAVATVTLELGIDIGDIGKVFQIGSTNSVASLRQRVGRSGRRDGIRKMKALATLTGAETLEEDLITTIAEIELMNEGWFEPPQAKRKEVSVLVSEILSVLAQYGNAYSPELYSLLCENGAFGNIDENLFHMIGEDMIESGLLELGNDDLMMLGEQGERETNDWHFYATFQSEESYSVRSGRKTIGEITPPSTSMQKLAEGGTFMLGGRYWAVQPPIDMKNKVINVKATGVKSQFLVPTSRGGGDVNGMIKRKRISLLTGKDVGYMPDYLDGPGRTALREARDFAKMHGLNGLGLMMYDAGEAGSETDSEIEARLAAGWNMGSDVSVRPPVDSSAYDALLMMFQTAGMPADGFDNIPMYRLVEIAAECHGKCSELETIKADLMSNAMVADLKNREKFNFFLSDNTLRHAYADELIDIDGADRWIEALLRFADTI